MSYLVYPKRRKRFIKPNNKTKHHEPDSWFQEQHNRLWFYLWNYFLFVSFLCDDILGLGTDHWFSARTIFFPWITYPTGNTPKGVCCMLQLTSRCDGASVQKIICSIAYNFWVSQDRDSHFLCKISLFFPIGLPWKNVLRIKFIQPINIKLIICQALLSVVSI